MEILLTLMQNATVHVVIAQDLHHLIVPLANKAVYYITPSAFRIVLATSILIIVLIIYLLLSVQPRESVRLAIFHVSAAKDPQKRTVQLALIIIQSVMENVLRNQSLIQIQTMEQITQTQPLIQLIILYLYQHLKIQQTILTQIQMDQICLSILPQAIQLL